MQTINQQRNPKTGLFVKMKQMKAKIEKQVLKE